MKSLEQVLRKIAGIPAAVAAQVCNLCGQKATEFRDSKSRREYTQSAMCQSCQDKVFKEE